MRRNDDSSVRLDHEALVDRVRVEAGFGIERDGVGIGKAPGYPGSRGFDHVEVGYAFIVGVSRKPGMVDSGFQPAPGAGRA